MGRLNHQYFFQMVDVDFGGEFGRLKQCAFFTIVRGNPPDLQPAWKDCDQAGGDDLISFLH